MAAATLVLISAVPTSAQISSAPPAGEPVPGQPYRAYTARDTLGRNVRFYVSEASGDSVRPLVLYVQGSGARSHFENVDGRLRPSTGHATLVDASGGRVRVVIVEKPGVTPFEAAKEPLPALFRVEHTLERWSEAVTAAFLAARRLPGVDTSRSLIVGHSEGGLIAARVAGRLPYITHVALLAAGGPSQLFDLLLLTRRGGFFRGVSADAAEREAYLWAQWDSILAHPDDAERMFLGHPYRRWASFLSSSPIRELDATRAQVFLAQGAEDAAVTRESFDVLASHLKSQGRRPEVRLVPGADHSFAVRSPDAKAADGWQLILSDVLRWFLGGAGRGRTNRPRAR